jgi:hypothetical protein
VVYLIFSEYALFRLLDIPYCQLSFATFTVLEHCSTFFVEVRVCFTRRRFPAGFPYVDICLPRIFGNDSDKLSSP